MISKGITLFTATKLHNQNYIACKVNKTNEMSELVFPEHFPHGSHIIK